MITGHTRVFGLVGHPIRHSRSPEIHNAWFKAHQLDAVYVAFDVPTVDGASLATAVRGLGVEGLNLTIPHKAAIVPHLDAIDTMGELVGGVNTVVLREGRLLGYNTDAPGFRSAFEGAFGPCRGASVLVLGAGGAGRAVGAGMAAGGAARVTWLNRTVAAAEAVAGRCRAVWPDTQFAGAALDAETFAATVGSADVVVQCTSGPGAETVRRFDVRGVRRDTIWCDINYWMPDPPHLEACRGRGLRTQDGLPMLVHQAAGAFSHFVGISPDPDAILSLLR